MRLVVLICIASMCAGCDKFGHYLSQGGGLPSPESSRYVSDFTEQIGESEHKIATSLIGTVSARCPLRVGLFEYVSMGLPLKVGTADRAEAGDIGAQKELAGAYLVGRVDIAKDEDKALYWFERAAAHDPDAAFDSALIEIRRAIGSGARIGKRPIERVAEAAYRDNREAQDCLAAIIYHQEPSAESLNESLYIVSDRMLGESTQYYSLYPDDSLLRDRKEQLRNKDFQMGVLLIRGNVVKKDMVRAAQHLRIAAKDNHSLAMGVLGLMYATGNGVSQSDRLAYKWLLQAAISNSDFNKVRDLVGERLSPDLRRQVQMEVSTLSE